MSPHFGMKETYATLSAGFEPAWGVPSGFLVHHLNYDNTGSSDITQ